ncbi:MAG: tRNA (N6-isopentenyl adenosine(37)-C2)-methylthiotransferase MiaB [Chitinophagales bacterium]|nr:tRNA (N6-isopentenyl adenosine(37)-C2)-methylthiotransferase MiaB [Chitinophagales bacterium]
MEETYRETLTIEPLALRDRLSLKASDENRQGEVYPEYSEEMKATPLHRKFYIESYGCQMNFSDSEIVASILMKDNFIPVEKFPDADLILINTCAIRESAEQKIRQRLTEFSKVKKKNPDALIGVLGCMAERLKSRLLEEEKIVDLVVGPDAYRDLPSLIARAEDGQKMVNVLLSREETYADISPVRLSSNGICAFISIMRGCNNMCSFCVVPLTRGRERSRDPYSIVKEAENLFDQGFREVTLLGQNVDSYSWKNEVTNESVTFAQLLMKVALIHSDLRVRFSTSHPKDITAEVILAINKCPNICSYIHLPLQSGSSAVLQRMNRTYTREWYINKVDTIRSLIPGCGISTDIIAGFCGETEEEHFETLEVMDYVQFDMGYMFKYSERPGTPAARKMKDDIPEQTKNFRLQQIVDLQHRIQVINNSREVGKQVRVLAEGYSKRSKEHLFGRSSENKVVVFPEGGFKKGDYVNVKILGYTSATLMGEAI